MKILVLNGSPKGDNSITLHTCLFLEKRFPEHKFSYLNVGQRIKAFEKDFLPAEDALKAADLIVFCYPVYTFLVPSQLHRFIELMKASGIDFKGKAASQVSTSKHFYDVTAHRFIMDNCADMGFRYVDGLSADMDDILTPKGRKQAIDWFEFMLWKLSRGEQQVGNEVSKSAAKKAVIVADLLPEDTTLKAMIDHFRDVFPYECDVINIEDFPFMGGCLSCFNCAATGKCV